jgi:hypothetical protein
MVYRFNWYYDENRRWILGPNGGDYEEYGLLGCNNV